MKNKKYYYIKKNNQWVKTCYEGYLLWEEEKAVLPFEIKEDKKQKKKN